MHHAVQNAHMLASLGWKLHPMASRLCLLLKEFESSLEVRRLRLVSLLWWRVRSITPPRKTRGGLPLLEQMLKSKKLSILVQSSGQLPANRLEFCQALANMWS